MRRARNRGRSARGKPPSREMGGNGPSEPSDRQKTEENRIDKPDFRRGRLPEDRQNTVRRPSEVTKVTTRRRCSLAVLTRRSSVLTIPLRCRQRTKPHI